MDEILKSVSDAVTQEAVTFDIDLLPNNKFQKWLQKIGWKKKKRSFEIKPLTLNQLQRVSKILLEINISDLSADGILNIMMNHSRSAAEIVAISVTESRAKVSKSLVDLFFNNLSKNDMTLALQIVLQQMSVVNFITTIASIRSLNILEKRTASVRNVSEVNPMNSGSSIAPGILSAVS